MRRLLRRVFHHRDSATRIARGVAAGFFGSSIPLPGLQIPISILCAWMARGNKAAAIVPQFLVNALTMLPMVYLEYRIGAALWPARAEEAEAALGGLKAALETWTISAPLESTRAFFASLGALGLHGMGPLLIGILVLGAAMAAAAYPLTLIAVWTWRARRRARRLLKGPRALAPLRLREADREEAAQTHEDLLRRYTRDPKRFVTARAVGLLLNGEQAFPAMLEAIDAAARAVDLETYILADDRTGTRFAEALSRAAARGLKVRLIFDAVGSLSLSDAYVRRLLEAGVEVAEYHPLLFWRPKWAINRRTHRKILVVDRLISFTGGLNLSDHYVPRAEGGEGWRDIHARIEGVEPAEEFTDLFEYAWHKAHRLKEVPRQRRKLRDLAGTLLPFPQPKRSTRQSGPGVPVQILGNREFRNRFRIRAAYLKAIRNARRYVLIEPGFFLPDRGIRRELRKAARRGVKVAVVCSRLTDPAISAVAGRALYSELLEAGVRIYEWPERMLHAKTAVVDDFWAVVGSYNINTRSLFHDLENVVVVADRAFARRLRGAILDDIGTSKAITMEDHEARPWQQMLLESAAYSLRYWI